MKKTVLITGGASGIGLLLGQKYAKEGASVVLVDCNREALDAAVAGLGDCAERVLDMCADVRDYSQVCEARDRAVAAFGSIDILINCAGGAERRICRVPGEFHEAPIEVYDFGIDLNLKGALYFDHAVMAQMAKQKSGVIVHLGSITGEEGSWDNISYAASKSALMNGMTKSIALAGAKYNIRCFCVAPGPVKTRPGADKMTTLIGRAAETEEIVDYIMYLASEKGSFVNGTYHLIDGGRNVMWNKEFY